LLRHAKSSWDQPGLPDADRPLALATLELDVERWNDLDHGTGTAVALVTPRSLEPQIGG
jgi:hypothetical protein